MCESRGMLALWLAFLPYISRVRGSIPFFVVCAWSLHVLASQISFSVYSGFLPQSSLLGLAPGPPLPSRLNGLENGGIDGMCVSFLAMSPTPMLHSDMTIGFYNCSAENVC